MKTVIVDVRSPAEAAAHIKSVWKSGEPETAARISFATPELLWGVLSAKRREPLKVLLGSGPMSIQDVARLAGCEITAVREDVKALLNAGVLDRAGASICLPFDRVKVEFFLEAQPADDLRSIELKAGDQAMQSRHKKANKRRYITARDVLADTLPSAIARRLKVN
jgi:predicted transcriptional regulator